MQRISFSIRLGLIIFIARAAMGQETGVSGAPERHFDPWKHYMQLVRDVNPRFAFQDDTSFAKWKPKLRNELLRILAVSHDPRAPLKSSVTPERSTQDYDAFRVVFEAARGVDVPCFLLKPKGASGPLPVMICLQGHKKERWDAGFDRPYS